MPASALRLLPANLSSLGLHAAPADPAWLPALYAFLRQHGASLNDLTLRFANASSATTHEEFPPTPMLDLSQVCDAIQLFDT